MSVNFIYITYIRLYTSPTYRKNQIVKYVFLFITILLLSVANHKDNSEKKLYEISEYHTGITPFSNFTVYV